MNMAYRAREIHVGGWVDPRAVMGTSVTTGWNVSAAITDRVPVDEALVRHLEGCRCGLEGPQSKVPA